MSTEARRVKRWAPKVFSGCSTCKRRRIKCDEKKPTCTRCARSNLQCEGYAPPLPRIFVPKDKSTQPSRSTPSRQDRECKLLEVFQPDSLTGRKAIFASPEDQELFAFFIKEPVILSGMYLQQHFWTVLVPERVREHAAIQHSVLALATIYRSLVSDEGFDDTANQRVVHHYNAAIRTLTQGRPTIVIVLITSILFYCTDYLRFAGYQAALNHLRAAFSILREFKITPGHEHSEHYEVITCHIEPIILRTWEVLGEPQAEQSDTTRSQITLPHEQESPIPPTAGTILLQLQGIVRSALHHINQPTEDSQAKLDVINGLVELPRNFNQFANLSTDPRGPPSRGRIYLAHHMAALIMLRELQQHLGILDILQQDGIVTAYRFMVDQLEEFLSATSHATSVQHTSIWNTLGLIAPLFLAIVRSPDEDLADRALKMLRSVDRTEGAWSSGLAANIAEALAQNEIQDNLGLCLSSLNFDRRANSMHIFDNSTDPVFDHYLPFSPVELASLDLDAIKRTVHNYGFKLNDHTSP